MPLRFADRMRGLRIGIGAPALLLALVLGLTLWSGIASAACPHGEPGAAVMASADALSNDMAPTDMAPTDAPPTNTLHSLSASSHVRHARDGMPDKPHKAVPPCCTGMACVTMHAGLPEAAAVVPVGPAGQSRPWAAVLLREGLGLRPDLPPPRRG